MGKGTPRLDRSITCRGVGLGIIMIIKIIEMMVKKMMTRRNDYKIIDYNEYNYCHIVSIFMVIMMTTLVRRLFDDLANRD